MKHACQQASQLTSDSFERKLSWLERTRLYTHLAMCNLCRSYNHNLHIMHDIFSGMRNHEHLQKASLPETSKAQILEAIKKER